MVENFGPSDWQQHYPTYGYVKRDIVIAEYEAAAQSAATEEKLFLSSGNIAFVVAAGLGSFALGRADDLYNDLNPILPVPLVFSLLVLLVLLFSGLTLKHFAERQKAIQFAKRKMVVLRAMLGLDFGHLQLVLPNWRLEGATQPFAIRLFPGWWTYAAYPFWVIGSFSAVLILVLTGHFVVFLSDDTLDPLLISFAAAAGWFVLLATIYRGALYDTNERPGLSFARMVASVLRVRLVDSVEYTLYRARLAAYELDRLSFDLSKTESMATFIEDRRFFSHRGISLRAAGRAIRDYLRKGKISGGSTISQQLARSLFVVDYHKLFRRKIVEMILTLWLERVLSKTDIMRLYLASVRFERGVLGIAAAKQHFFEQTTGNPTEAQTFVLIERIGNIRGRILSRRIDDLLTQATAAGVFSREEACSVVRIYRDLADSNLLAADNPASFLRLQESWCGIEKTTNSPGV